MRAARKSGRPFSKTQMSHHRDQARRRRRGGRQNRHREGSDEMFRNPRHNRPAPKPSLLQRLLGFFGLGKKKPAPAKPAARPVAAERPSGGAQADRRDRPERAERPPRADKPARTPRPPVTAEVTSGRLYVGNLAYEVTESDLFELFSGIGKLKNAEVVCNKHTQRSKGFAFVEMLSVEEAKRAVEVLNDKEFMGRKLLVSGAKSPGFEHDGASSDQAAPPTAPATSEPASEPAQS